MNRERQTILFIDDEQNVLSSLRRLLHEEPWNLRFADSGAKGLEILKKEDVALVISDVRMPGMDGITFMKQVKELYPQIVRIFLSGYADQKAVIRALSEGCAQQLLSKPWKDKELIEVIRGALMQAEELKKKNEGLQKIINSLSSLPPMPQAYLEIKNCLIEMDNLSIEQMAEIIQKDTSIAAELLRWANSALFGQMYRVDTVKRAMLVLGLDIVEGLILSKSIFGSVLSSDQAVPGFNRNDFHIHSMACAISAKLLINKLPYSDRKNSDRAFTAGLLHDIGKLVEERYLIDDFKRVIDMACQKKMLIVDAEYELLETTHEEIGSHLANWWNLPAFLVNAIRWHHKPSLCNTDHDIIMAVHVADVLVHKFELGASGNFRYPDTDAASWDHFGLTEEELSSIKDSVIHFLL